MRRPIKFLLGSEVRELQDVGPTETVLDYLRLREKRVGTKEGCAEGDCGACTVVVGSLEDGEIEYRAVNSCIQFLHGLDGQQLITVEDLKDTNRSLHPVQKAMVQEHGSQCGFCTPGFVMSLFALYQKGGGVPDLNEIDDALAGNLCRCTGYGPIISAARKMRDFDGGYNPADGAKALLERLQDDQSISIVGPGDGPEGGSLYAPTTCDELAELLLEHPDATLIAGATDVGLWMTKALQVLDTVIFLGRVSDLRGIHESDGAIEFGATTTFTEALPVITRHYPRFGEVLRRLGSVQVRNLGTLGGNIANGSPIADTPPPLIALGATLTLRRGETRRTIPLEDFFIAYGEQDLATGEFIETIHLPKPSPDSQLHCFKVSKRFDQDISALLAAINVTVVGGKVGHIRIAFGGMAGTPKRALNVEAAMIGQPWTLEAIEKAIPALAEDYTPIDDHRASAAYRMEVAGNLLRKALADPGDDLLSIRRAGHG